MELVKRVKQCMLWDSDENKRNGIYSSGNTDDELVIAIIA